MRIILKNEYGSIEIGGGNHPVFRLRSIEGIGLPQKVYESVTFAGNSGAMFDNIADSIRHITMLVEISGGPRDIERLYMICNEPVEITFITRYMRRKILGQVFTNTDIESVIYNKLQNIALQFDCESPYFTDLLPIKVPLFEKTDHFPNTAEDGEWQILLPAVATTSRMSGTVRNIGGTILYPTILIKNTGDKRAAQTGLNIKNHTTGAEIKLSYTMEKDDIVTLDLARRRITALMGDITNKISDDTVLSDFFLKVGENELSVTSEGAQLTLYAECEYLNNYIAVVI